MFGCSLYNPNKIIYYNNIIPLFLIMLILKRDFDQLWEIWSHVVQALFW